MKNYQLGILTINKRLVHKSTSSYQKYSYQIGYMDNILFLSKSRKDHIITCKIISTFKIYEYNS